MISVSVFHPCFIRGLSERHDSHSVISVVSFILHHYAFPRLCRRGPARIAAKYAAAARMMMTGPAGSS